MLLLLSSCLPTLRLLCLLYSAPHPAFPGPVCDWLSRQEVAVKLVEQVKVREHCGRLICFTNSFVPQLFLSECCNLFFFFFLSLTLQNATHATIAAASEQGKTAPDASGWQRGERGWRARTWRSKKTREQKRSAGIETKRSLKEEHNMIVMIVETKHLFFCLGFFRETLFTTSRCYDVIAVPIVQLVLHPVICVTNELIFRCIQCPSHNMHFTLSSHR